jgi:hypothetical protein
MAYSTLQDIRSNHTGLDLLRSLTFSHFYSRDSDFVLDISSSIR